MAQLTLAQLCRLLICMIVLLSVFQAVALAVGAAWYPPQTLLQLALTVLFVAYVAAALKLRIPKALRPEMLALGLFFLYALVSAVLLPRYFAGIYILYPTGGLDEEINSPTPLAFDRGNIGQPIFLLMNIAMVVACVVFRSPAFCRSLLSCWLVAGWISLFFAAYQKLSMLFGIYFPAEILYSNGGYSVGFGLTLDGYERLNSTFTEPSCAGNVFGAYFCYYLYEFARTRQIGAVLTALLYAVAVVLTASAVGYIEILVALLLVTLQMSGRLLTALAFLLGAVAALAATYFWVPDLVSSVILNKAASGSFLNRTASDLFSLDLAVQTKLLGVGLGSNRPSSFLTYLLSNVGLFGLLSFTGFIFLLFRAKRGLRYTGTRLPSLCAALLVFLAGKVVGVPDLNVWFMWGMVGLIACEKACLYDREKGFAYRRHPMVMAEPAT